MIQATPMKQLDETLNQPAGPCVIVILGLPET
jgi:hypothetical protein